MLQLIKQELILNCLHGLFLNNTVHLLFLIRLCIWICKVTSNYSVEINVVEQCPKVLLEKKEKYDVKKKLS